MGSDEEGAEDEDATQEAQDGSEAVAETPGADDSDEPYEDATPGQAIPNDPAVLEARRRELESFYGKKLHEKDQEAAALRERLARLEGQLGVGADGEEADHESDGTPTPADGLTDEVLERALKARFGDNAVALLEQQTQDLTSMQTFEEEILSIVSSTNDASILTRTDDVMATMDALGTDSITVAWNAIRAGFGVPTDTVQSDESGEAGNSETPNAVTPVAKRAQDLAAKAKRTAQPAEVANANAGLDPTPPERGNQVLDTREAALESLRELGVSSFADLDYGV
jgi:hypothetical protein